MPDATRRSSPPARTYLYVPGDRPDRFSKAAASGSDAVVLDLEDGVAADAKAAAREAVAAFQRPSGPQWWVRVDPADLAASVAAAARPGTAGVFVPKADVEILDEVERRLTSVERSEGIEDRLAIIGLVETPDALLRLGELVRCRRLQRLGIGEADLAASLGMAPDEDRRELWAIRSDVVVASTAGRLLPPVGPVPTTFDEKLLESSTRQLVRQGFAARTLIHPRQVRTVVGALAPSESEVAAARSVVAAFERARQAGSGVVVDEDGRFVDLAVVRSARSVLARAG